MCRNRPQSVPALDEPLQPPVTDGQLQPPSARDRLRHRTVPRLSDFDQRAPSASKRRRLTPVETSSLARCSAAARSSSRPHHTLTHQLCPRLRCRWTASQDLRCRTIGSTGVADVRALSAIASRNFQVPQTGKRRIMLASHCPRRVLRAEEPHCVDRPQPDDGLGLYTSSYRSKHWRYGPAAKCLAIHPGAPPHRISRPNNLTSLQRDSC